MTKKQLIYLVRNEEDPTFPYWEQFDSLQDAVSTHPKEQVFTAKPRLLGRFRMKNAPVRLKVRKRA